MEIVKVHIDLIKPYWRNPRKNESAVSAVVASIKQYGYNVPLVVDKDNLILAGHTRYKALRQLGAQEIPVIRVDLPEIKARQFRIADNKAHEFTEWDIDTLKAEIHTLMEGEEGLGNLEAVFGSADWREVLDVKALIPDTKPEDDQEDVVPESGYQGNEDNETHFTVICPHCLEDNRIERADLIDSKE
jgi:site-specific DNA-methyltransferase (adenine-specific)